MEKQNEHKHSWIVLLVMAFLNFTTACDWYCQYPWHKPLLPICQTTDEQQQTARNTHVVIHKTYSAQRMLKAFLQQQIKNEEENSPLGLFCMKAFFLGIHAWSYLLLRKHWHLYSSSCMKTLSFLPPPDTGVQSSGMWFPVMRHQLPSGAGEEGPL